MKRKGYPSRYDRQQDAKIRKLETNIIVKQHITTSSATTTEDTAVEFLLNGIAQGETDLTREGAEIRMQSISIRFLMHGSPVATVATGGLRVMLFIDKDPRGALPDPTDYLTTQQILSGYNTGRVIGQERHRGRFKFLFDHTYDMVNRPIASADSLPQLITDKVFKKLGNIRSLYTDDTGVIGVIEQATLILAILSSDHLEGINFEFNAVLRFTAPD